MSTEHGRLGAIVWCGDQLHWRCTD